MKVAIAHDTLVVFYALRLSLGRIHHLKIHFLDVSYKIESREIWQLLVIKESITD